jgi:hypothetical protein
MASAGRTAPTYYHRELVRVAEMADNKAELGDRRRWDMRQSLEDRVQTEHANHLGHRRAARMSAFDATVSGATTKEIRTCSTKMTTPTAVMKPLRRARDRTTSRKPSRKRPSAKVMMPTCPRSRDRQRGRSWALPISSSHLEGEHGCDIDSDADLLRLKDLAVTVAVLCDDVCPDLVDCIADEKAERSFGADRELVASP